MSNISQNVCVAKKGRADLKTDRGGFGQVQPERVCVCVCVCVVFNVWGHVLGRRPARDGARNGLEDGQSGTAYPNTKRTNPRTVV